MNQSILDDGITGKIQNKLWNMGIKCDCQRLTFFTDKPFHEKSHLSPNSENLSNPYITSFGYKTACKFYEQLH